jgi:hypothetical protein
VWQGKAGQGRVAVLGSVLLFDDAWLDKEENGRLADFLFRWLLPDGGLEVSHRRGHVSPCVYDACRFKEEDTCRRLKRGPYLLVGSKKRVTCLSIRKQNTCVLDQKNTERRDAQAEWRA